MFTRPRTRSSRRFVAVSVAAVLAMGVLTSSSTQEPRRDGAAARPAPPVATADTRIGELPERRTRTSATRRNRDGTYTITTYAAPVHYRAADGTMQPIDPSLHPASAGGYAWRTGANTFEMGFMATAGRDLAELRVGGRTVRIHAEHTAETARTRPATVNGSEITYSGAYPGADLRYLVGTTGVKEVIDLAGPDSPSSYTFRMSTGDGGPELSAVRRPDGSYAVVLPPLDGAAIVIAAPFVQEAAGEHEVAPPADDAKPQLRIDKQGRDLVVTLSLDPAWLRAPERRFPVQLDPTIIVQPDVEDASFVTKAGYLPYVSDRIFIGSSSTGHWRGALQFDLGAVPPGAQVTSAALGLYFDGVCIAAAGPFCGGTSHLMDAHRLTSAWSTSSTFDRLTMDATPAGSFTLPSTLPGGWMSWPITSTVSAWLNGTQPNYGLIVKRRTETFDSSGPVPPGRRFTGSTALHPKLDITYTSDGVDLLEPATLHSDGADLAWTTYTGPSGAPFDRYEVHRGSSPNFTPNDATLLTTIRDVGVTTYRDTTAAPGKSFTYKVVANTSSSNARTVTLPAAGLASKVLQPGPQAGRNTYLYYTTTLTNCANYGAGTAAWVGTSATSRWRNAISFDLRDIPQNATINQATLSVYQISSPGSAMSVQAHRITRPWKEGTGQTQCTGDGATWYETEGGQPWTTLGGDIDATVAARVDVAAGAPSRFHDFPITGLVQGWVNGATANNGVLLRATDETLRDNNSLVYATDDYTSSTALRPRLAVTYVDGSVAQGPRVSVAAPGPGSTVSGSAVRLAASAADDRRVDQVEFLVNGAVVGADNVTPFEVGWNSASVGNGVKTVAVRATDDAGNVTTSAAVSVTVDNSAPPTGALTAPAAGATVGGQVTVSATASDDFGVAHVQFLVDGVRVGAPDTTAPYSVTWNTLDPLAGIYNGAHVLTAAVTDTSGLQYVTAPRSVTLDNLGATLNSVDYLINDPASALDDVFPPVMAENTNPGVPVQDPYAGTVNPDGTSGGSLGRSLGSAPQDNGASGGACPAGAYCPTITVANTSGTTWRDSTAQVWYRWYATNGAVMFEGRSSASFPSNFRKNDSQAFPLTIYPPALPPGMVQGTYRLRVDVYDPASGTWFAANGNPPLDNPILIVKSLATKLGLERYYQYEAEPVGAGMTALTNTANGNMLLRWTPFFAPGRGLATMVDLTYNSLEDHSKSPAGNNMSLSMSGLIRFGEPLDIHPNKADEISGQSNKWVELTDGDGTTHRFTGTTGTDGVTRWQEPPGVNLYLRSLPSTDTRGRWALTRPDKVTYFFDVDGFPAMVEDRNGNRVVFGLQDTPPGEDPGGPKKRIVTVSDAGGRSFGIDYWSKDEAKKAHVRGKIQTITDHSGSRLDFDYYEDGNLLRLTQRGGTTASGQFLPDRSFVFTYTTSNGAGPAITDPAARVNPEPRTPNQSTRLFSVRDPRGAETTFAYYLATDGQHLRWKLKSRTNRSGQATTLSYDLTNRVTAVSAPLARTTNYTYDPTGKVTRIVNPKNEATDVAWTADFKVERVTEPTGGFTTYSYNPNGYLTSRTNQASERTELTYLDQAVDGNDTGRHLSLLATVTRPKGVATTTVAGDFQWSYGYDSAGNLDKVTDPTGATTDYDYNLAGSAHPGTLSAVRDANGNPATTFPAYDPSGQPTEVRDPLGNLTRISYDADGLVRWIQDPNHANDTGADERAYRTYFDYDSFHRLGRQSAPKSTGAARGTLLWSSVDHDANDNVVRSVAAHYGPATGDPGTGPVTSTTYNPTDLPLLLTGADTSADPAGERMTFDYDAAGRLVKVTRPKGVASSTVDDFASVFGYDPLDRVVRRTDYGTSTTQVRATQLCYDVAGDLRSITAPRAGTAAVTCPGSGPASAGFTAEIDYDPAHRPVVQRDELGHARRIGYDANGNVVRVESDIVAGRVSRTDTDYDQRDMPVLVRDRFDGATGRDVITRVEYDRNGNRSRVVSPRGSDAGGAGPFTNYVTGYVYDALNRVTRIDLPFDSRDGLERQYLHRAYDPNGNMLWTSLPVTSSTPTAVTDTARTVMTHFDPGWIRTSDDPANPKVHFDYAAQGWQVKRAPERRDAPGQLDESRAMTWGFHVDGTLKSRKDQNGQATTYTYDPHNNLLSTVDLGGVTDPSEQAIETQQTYTGFDELAKSRSRKQGAATWKFTDYTYDANSNVTVRRENGEESTAGTLSKAPRRYQMTYDAADWLTQQLDLGVDGACKDDQRIVNTFWGTGQERQRDVYRAGATCTTDPATWPKKQTTTWTHFDNGLLRQLRTTNGSGALTESHDVGYFDDAGIYLNGHRTRDRYVLKRTEGNAATTCVAASPCDAEWEYDARDRLLRHQLRVGKENTYRFDEPDKLLGDKTLRAGNATTQVENGVTRTMRYTGDQLTDSTVAGVTAKYWYDPFGNLDCITTASGTAANCSPSTGGTVANLLADYRYDYLNRLASVRQYSGTTLTDQADYTYDALDRTVREVENHAGTGNDRTTTFTYQGLTNLVTEERQAGGTNPKTRTYAYDSYGHRIGLTDLTNATGAQQTYSYGTDVHGSVSQLIDDAGVVRASYGYTAYGGTDAPPSDGQSLTTGDTNAQAPLNPMRYAGRRIDSGTATSATAQPGYDMGARRFGPEIARFLQGDAFGSAVGDLGLAVDPLTQNRYSLAGGNPVSFVEVDGHTVIADGGGGSSSTPNPTTSTASSGGGAQQQHRTGRDCAVRLDCTIEDFNQMPVSQRKEFVNQFQRLYGERWHVSGWFDNINGVLKFMQESGVAGTNTWASWVDSSILHGFERGMAMAQGRTGGSQGNPGADKWQRFFNHSRQNPGDSDQKRRLWSQAEETATRHGYDIADQKGASPQLNELMFAGGAHAYRWGMRHMGVSRTIGRIGGGALGNAVCGPMCGLLGVRLGGQAAQDFLDPNSEGPTYYGGHIFNGIGRVAEGDVVGGGAELVRGTVEGAGAAGGWLLDQFR